MVPFSLFHVTTTETYLKMSSILFILATLAASSLAGPSPTLALSEPLCFTPPDRHQVSNVVSTCSTLLSSFVDKYEPRGSVRRWTPDPKETGKNVVHIPILDSRVDTNSTHACLLEVLDQSGIPDSFPATEIQTNGRLILNKCFTQNKCGLIALPPHYTTDLVLCGSYHQSNVSDCLQTLRAARRPPTLEID